MTPNYRCRPCGAPLGDAPKCEYCGCRNPEHQKISNVYVDHQSYLQHAQAQAQNAYSSKLYAESMALRGILGGAIGGFYR